MAACVAVGSVMFVLRGLILSIFSPNVAKSPGINVDRVNFIYLCAFGVTILLGLHNLGAMLVGAMISVPAAIGRRLARTLKQFMTFSAAAGMVSWLSAFLGHPDGVSRRDRPSSALYLSDVALGLAIRSARSAPIVWPIVSFSECRLARV